MAVIRRRALFALPLLAVPARAQRPDALAGVLATCWRARGANFDALMLAQRIGSHTGRAALLALAGVAVDREGEEWEIAVEIIRDSAVPPSPAAPLLARLMADDLARGLPLAGITGDGRALLIARAGDADGMALVGRPVIAGA